MCGENFRQPIFAKFGAYKWKPLGTFSFRQLHRALIEFHDYEIQEACCKLAGVESVKDELSFGYCCVDEDAGLQIFILGAYNRDGRLDYWVPVPEGQEIRMSYQEAKDKMISVSDTYADAITRCLPRCKQLMERHETNPSVVWNELDKFRNIEHPLDVRVTIPAENGLQEQILIRPTGECSCGLLDGVVLEDSKTNGDVRKGTLLKAKILRNQYGHVEELVQHIVGEWVPVDDGNCIGEIGPDGGIILETEEFAGRCRITMEDCTHYVAITCGIYGSMVHTAFTSREKANALYDEMKQELQFICENYDPDSIEDLDEYLERIADFVDTY